MGFEITKGDITIRTDSEREAARVLAWFNDGPALPSGPTGTVRDGLVDVQRAVVVAHPIPLPAGLPGPTLPPHPFAPGGFLEKLNAEPPQDTAGGKLLALNPPEPQMIPVRGVLMEVLDVVLHFPEGITAKGISELSGVPLQRISHRLTRLKRMGLVESMKGSINWRATQMARRAKLVAS